LIEYVGVRGAGVQNVNAGLASRGGRAKGIRNDVWRKSTAVVIRTRRSGCPFSGGLGVAGTNMAVRTPIFNFRSRGLSSRPEHFTLPGIGRNRPRCLNAPKCEQRRASFGHELIFAAQSECRRKEWNDA
jgi:hypothetical protein